jgi:rubrerythrin
MSGRGETPENEDEEPTANRVSLGEKVYNTDGEILGEIRGIEEGGFFVTSREGVERLSIEHARSGQSFGEAELMWRCSECGEMGEIDEGFPDICPNCGTEKENIMYWTED